MNPNAEYVVFRLKDEEEVRRAELAYLHDEAVWLKLEQRQADYRALWQAMGRPLVALGRTLRHRLGPAQGAPQADCGAPGLPAC